MWKPLLIKSIENQSARAAIRRAIAGVLVLFLSVMPMSAALAVDVPTLYTANVSYDKESRNAREDAYRAALIAVLARVSGSELSENGAVVDELFPVPAAYVTRFRPGDDDTLWVSFDDQAIERILKGAGQTVWGRDRPLTMVWLAVDWGNGNREIVSAGDPDRQGRSIDRNRLLRERVLEIAQERGLPIAFPLMDTTDLQSVSSSDIWGGFDERVVAASARYEAGSVLIGRVRPSSSQRNRWTYIFGGETRSWTGEAEAVIVRIADTLATEFAVGGNAPLERLALNVSGIESVTAFGELQKRIADVGMIENARIAAVSGDIVRYEVEARGGTARLSKALRFAGLLPAGISDQPFGVDDMPTLNFHYSHDGFSQ